MLSFQQDQTDVLLNKNGANSSQPQNSNAASTNKKQQEYFSVSSRQGQVRKSTYLLTIIFIMGALTLLFMIKKSTPTSASASAPTANRDEQLQIEDAIGRLIGVKSQMFSGLEKIVNKFYEFSDFEQVDIDELKKNPFEIDRFLKNTGDEDSLAITVYNDLELFSIMKTERGNCCMINDKILYEGDSIRGLKVSRITDKDVKLRSEEIEIVLKLSDSF